MEESRIRAPFRVLEELLGEPDPGAGGDKCSTAFVAAFEDGDFVVHDFHKPEWQEQPECLTDPGYIWSVFGDGLDVRRFCAWLSAEVIKRVPRATTATYGWPLPGDPVPSPPAPPKPAPKAVAPKVRARNKAAAPPVPDAHRRRTLLLQAALDDIDPIALAELRADLSRLGPAAQALAELIAREPELKEAAARKRLGPGFDGACAELDALLRAH